MFGLFIVVSLAIVSFLVYFFFKKGSPRKKIEHIVPVDPTAQALYNQKYQPEEKTLSLEEKIEKSWQFLVNIREYIINKFSQDDQDKIYEAGHKLHNHGMKYLHDINDLGSITQTSQAISKEVSKKGQSASR